MSPEQREKYSERQNNYQREYQRRRSKQMSPEQHEKRNKRAREYRKRWSPEQRKRYNKVKSRGARVRHKKRREVVQKYKVLKGCYICGFNKHYSALDFDHINRDTKIKNVSRLVTDTCSWKTVVAEIRKSRVLCANCHRIKTHENKDYMNMNTTEFKNENKRT